MSELKITRHTFQPHFPNEIWIEQNGFTITLKQGEDVDIECNWDYGYGGRGTEHISIPIETLQNLINEIQSY